MNNTMGMVGGMNAEFQSLLQKKQKNAPITLREAALVIANDEETLLKFMVDNDLAQVHRLLHMSDAPLVVGETASFVPNKARVEGELNLLLTKKEWDTLNQIASQFVWNPKSDNYTTNKGIVASLQDMKVLTCNDAGCKLNVKLS
jgi:hypothetical protein